MFITAASELTINYPDPTWFWVTLGSLALALAAFIVVRSLRNPRWAENYAVEAVAVSVIGVLFTGCILGYVWFIRADQAEERDIRAWAEERYGLTLNEANTQDLALEDSDLPIHPTEELQSFGTTTINSDSGPRIVVLASEDGKWKLVEADNQELPVVG